MQNNKKGKERKSFPAPCSVKSVQSKTIRQPGTKLIESTKTIRRKGFSEQSFRLKSLNRFVLRRCSTNFALKTGYLSAISVIGKVLRSHRECVSPLCISLPVSLWASLCVYHSVSSCCCFGRPANQFRWNNKKLENQKTKKIRQHSGLIALSHLKRPAELPRCFLLFLFKRGLFGFLNFEFE